jgi:hypothetical protein
MWLCLIAALASHFFETKAVRIRDEGLFARHMQMVLLT